MEHHSNIVPWQMLAAEMGAIVKAIPITDSGEIDLDAYRELLKSNRVKVLGIVHISNSIGTVNPVKEMARMAHEAGALVLIDGAQAGPHWPVDVQDLDADFYTLSCHKMYAPTGVGVLYGKRALLEALPAYQGGGSMIRTVSFEETTYADLPAKFEPGTPNIAGAIGLGSAIEYVGRLGSGGKGKATREDMDAAMAAIHAHELTLARYAQALLGEIPGVRLIGTANERAGIVSFVIDGVHPHDIGSVLDGEGIAIRAGHHCCMPLMKRMGVSATARASFALYNTPEDVEALAKGVLKVKEMFA
jgi:cysteine desulfurase/selenocysteine lyase